MKNVLLTDGQVMDEESWEVSTTRALCRTLLFDSGKAVLFHPEKGNSGDSSPDEGESESCGKITGDEAKQFYEDVLSMPQQGIKTESIKPTGCRTLQRTHRKKKTVDKNKGGGFVSVSQLFRFAQEGDLVSLKPALQSGFEGTYDINIVDNFDWTLLMCAAHAGHMDVVTYLLNEGAGWQEFVDRRGNNAVDLARKSGHFDIAETIENFERFEDHHYHGDHTRNSHKRSRENNGDAGTKSKKKKSFSYYCKTCELNIVESSVCVPSSHDTSTVHQFSCQHHPRVSSYGIPESNRGFQMLVKGGWDPGKGLGSMRQGRQYPVKTILKRDRLGFGLSSKEGGTPRVTHFSAHDENAVRTCRERARRESSPHKTKRERTRAVERERRWEIRMRRYMNSDS